MRAKVSGFKVFALKKWLILALSVALLGLSIQSPAQASDAVTNARAELAATMKSLETAKTNLTKAQQEQAAATAASVKIEKELKVAQSDLAKVQAEMDALNVEIDTNQAKLDEIVRTAYKMGISKEWLMVDIVISTDSDQNIMRKLETLNLVLDSSSDVLGVLITAKAELAIKVQDAQTLAAEIQVKSEEAKKLVADLAKKTQTAKDEANRVQALANEKEAVLRKLVFAGLPTSGTIIGADISNWQHPGNKNIDFIKMYDAGVRFLFIKGSSGGDAANALAIKWSTIDFPKAREAGLLVGIYHAAFITPGSSVESAANQGVAQANRAVANMNALGGYKPGVLPIVLDVEGFTIAGWSPLPSSAVVTAFTTAFANTVTAQIGKKPIIYSNASFLQTYLKDPAFKSYPLWVANYGSNSNPGMSNNGTVCYTNPWTTNPGCVLDWTFWQYTSTANGPTYGIASGALDLNRLGKSINTLLSLASY